MARAFKMLGVIVNNGLLSEHLVFDLMGGLRWSKAEPIVYGMRKEMGGPRLFEFRSTGQEISRVGRKKST